PAAARRRPPGRGAGAGAVSVSIYPYPAAPLSEVEWEELLVRYELTPRALRAALDDAVLEGGAGERVGDLLRALVVNELLVTELFAAMRDARPVLQERRIEVMSADPRAAYER